MFGQPQTCRKDVQKYHELRDAASNDIGITSIYSWNNNSIKAQFTYRIAWFIDEYSICPGPTATTFRNIPPHTHHVRVS